MSGPAAARPIVRIGPIARRVLAAGDGRVIAVFARSLYVETPAGIACIGDAALGDGPLNALITAAPGWSALGVLPGTPLRRTAGGLLLGPVPVALEEARPWSPPSADAAPGGLSFPAGALARAAGLARLIPQLRRQRRFAGAVRLAARALGATARHPADLLGLGPGLTPAGDDFLGGALIAWRAAGRPDFAARLWSAIGPQLAARTGRIARAHLEAARLGLGHGTLHAALARPDARSLRELAAVGHTSGWDALAGCVAALASGGR